MIALSRDHAGNVRTGVTGVSTGGACTGDPRATAGGFAPRDSTQPMCAGVNRSSVCVSVEQFVVAENIVGL
jgi:hypothetical protein